MPGRLRRRRRRLVALAATLLLTLIAVVVWVGSGSREASVAAEPPRATTEAAVLPRLPEAFGGLEPVGGQAPAPVGAPADHSLTAESGLDELQPQAHEPLAQGYVISVEERDVVMVPDLETAMAVIEEIKEEYKQSVLQGATSIERVQVMETLAFHPRMAPASLLRDKEQAKNILRRGTDKLIYYTVQRGDTLWDIAHARGLELTALQKANPDVTPETLQIGQQLNMVIAEPFIHLYSEEVQVYTVSVAFREEVKEDPNLWPWQYEVISPGRYGQREITERIIRQDGQVVEREVVENKLLAEPVTQVSVRGSRLAPDLGTGSLHWPVQGGYLTSPFGWRWGAMHEGIDLGASRGTPIYAADNGTVVYRGWRGNYGNTILIDHGSGKMVTLYAHMHSFSVEVGDQVTKGQTIGTVGSTGWSTGPHLHFEVWLDNTPVNPLQYYQ